MLLLQSVPYFRAMGDRIRWHEGEEHTMLPAHLLSLLDYTRDLPAWERSELYEPCIEAMKTFPGLERQILMRLRDDARTLPVATTVGLLRQAGSIRPVGRLPRSDQRPVVPALRRAHAAASAAAG